MKEAFKNLGLVSEDGYVKVREGLWVAPGPYKKQSWNDTDKSILPTKEELNEIYLKLHDIIEIQEACGLSSLKQILTNKYFWIWSSTKYNRFYAWVQRMSDGDQNKYAKYNDFLIVPSRSS